MPVSAAPGAAGSRYRRGDPLRTAAEGLVLEGLSAHDQLDRWGAQQDDGRRRVAGKVARSYRQRTATRAERSRSAAQETRMRDRPKRRRSTLSMLGASVFLSLSR